MPRKSRRKSARYAVRREHYRRIAYAHAKFEQVDPGWRTGRGTLYLVLGPPDEILSRPPRFERWTCREIERPGDNVAFEFHAGRLAPESRALLPQ